MAWTVQDRFAIEMGNAKSLARASRNSLSRKVWRDKGLCPFVARKELTKLVAKHSDATWLETYDGNTRFDFWRKFIHDLQQSDFARSACRGHRVDVRSIAGCWHCHAEIGSFEHFYGSLRSSRDGNSC